MMMGIYFYLQVIFCILMLSACSAAFYMGILHAHRNDVGFGRKAVSGLLSIGIAVVCCYLMYSWTYLSW